MEASWRTSGRSCCKLSKWESAEFLRVRRHRCWALQMMARIRHTLKWNCRCAVFRGADHCGIGLELDKAQATGVKARPPVFQRHHHADPADATKRRSSWS